MNTVFHTYCSVNIAEMETWYIDHQIIHNCAHMQAYRDAEEGFKNRLISINRPKCGDQKWPVDGKPLLVRQCRCGAGPVIIPIVGHCWKPYVGRCRLR